MEDHRHYYVGCKMNEHMLELAKRAGLKKSHGSDREYMGDFDWRLFSDLVIRECVAIVNTAVDHREPASTYASKIQKHFGIEE
jgi:hypothetical protein